MLALVAGLLVGCDNPDAEIVPFDDFNSDDELIGRWQWSTAPHLNVFLIFNADGTGAERQDSYQIFAWTTENGYLIIEGEFSGNFSYSIDGELLLLTGIESGNTSRFSRVD